MDSKAPLGNTIPGGVMHQDSCMTYWVAYDNFWETEKNSQVCMYVCSRL